MLRIILSRSGTQMSSPRENLTQFYVNATGGQEEVFWADANDFATSMTNPRVDPLGSADCQMLVNWIRENGDVLFHVKDPMAIRARFREHGDTIVAHYDALHDSLEEFARLSNRITGQVHSFHRLLRAIQQSAQPPRKRRAKRPLKTRV